jgi:hypothetical protein
MHISRRAAATGLNLRIEILVSAEYLSRLREVRQEDRKGPADDISHAERGRQQLLY